MIETRLAIPRITSYNVCYTKLLRDTPSQEVPIDTVSKVMITIPTAAMSMANSDRMNAILQREAPPSPQLEKVENQYKPKHKSR